MAKKIGEAAGEREAINTGAMPRVKARRPTAAGNELLELASIVEGLLPEEPRSERVRLRTLIVRLGGQGPRPANAVDVAQQLADEDGEFHAD